MAAGTGNGSHGLGRPQRKVVHLLIGDTIGGVENQLQRVLPRLAQNQFENILCFLKGTPFRREDIQGPGIRNHHLGGLGAWDWRILWRLYGLLRAERPTILHCYTSKANWAGALVGGVARVPAILLSDRAVRTWIRPWQRWADRVSFRIARGMTVPSEAIRDFNVSSVGLDGDRIWVLPNGVDVQEFSSSDTVASARGMLGLERDGQWVGFVGRLDEPIKGIRYLLEATASLRPRMPRTRLLIVGEGPAEGDLRERAKMLGLEDGVRFMGLRFDIPRVMKALDLLVLPSLGEGCPNVVLEAMAATVPVVATRVGGVPELICHGETGWLVPAGDSGALAEGISATLGDLQRAREMAQRARGWVETHRSIDGTARALTHLYDRLEEGLVGRIEDA